MKTKLVLKANRWAHTQRGGLYIQRFTLYLQVQAKNVPRVALSLVLSLKSDRDLLSGWNICSEDSPRGWPVRKSGNRSWGPPENRNFVKRRLQIWVFVWFIIIQFRFGTVQVRSVQLSSVQVSSTQFSSVQLSSTQFSSVHFSSVQLSPVQFNHHL